MGNFVRLEVVGKAAQFDVAAGREQTGGSAKSRPSRAPFAATGRRARVLPASAIVRTWAVRATATLVYRRTPVALRRRAHLQRRLLSTMSCALRREDEA
jgi:hypothetical protein